MSQTVNKSAISVLDEFCKRKRQPPADYTFIPSNDATEFICTVKSFNETKTGKAKSKKKAKHAAAESLINHLRNMESCKFDLVFLSVPNSVMEDTKVSSSTTNENNKCKATGTTAKAEPETNYIGKLLEHCVKSKLPPASFDMIEHATKANNQSEFCMKCTVKGVEGQGKGLNKKQAKQRAAMELLKKLTTEPTSQDDNAKIDEPPMKRLKTLDESNDTETTGCEKIEVSKEENKETAKENQFIDFFGQSSDSDCTDDERTSGSECIDDDCEEIVNPVEVYSVDSESDSEQEFGNSSDFDEF